MQTHSGPAREIELSAPMMDQQTRPTRFDATLRIGCQLAYQVTGTATLLLNIRPRRDRGHQVLSESVLLGNNLPAEEFVDHHGNSVYRVALPSGLHSIRHDAIVSVSSQPDNHDLVQDTAFSPAELPVDLLRYTLPSRYCDSDKLVDFAWQQFGQVPHGRERVQAISLWLKNNIEYRYMSGSPLLSAWDVLQRGYGVCRDFAHLAVALNRTFNLPARFVTGHLPDMGFPDPEQHMDFHAYAEVYLGGNWFTTDARFHVPRIGRVKISCGFDAVDGAFSTIFGGATLSHFQVWAYQISPGTVGIGDPLDLSRRLDNQSVVQTNPVR